MITIIFSTIKRLLKFSVVIFLFCGETGFSQDIHFKRTSIKTGVGVGINDTETERGIGPVFSLGWQKSYLENERLRLNPNILFGSFRTYAIPTDSRDQHYKTSALGFNVHYDLIKKNTTSLVTTGGVFVNYSRGLLGTGGLSEGNNSSEYFYSLYFGGYASIAIRINSKNKKVAYELRPLNIHFGNEGFILGYLFFGIDFKLREN